MTETPEEAYERGRREREAEIVEALQHILFCTSQKLLGDAWEDTKARKETLATARYDGGVNTSCCVHSLLAEWGHQHPGFYTEPGSHKEWLGEHWADLVSGLPHVKARRRREEGQRKIMAEHIVRGWKKGAEA